jgi:uncharacterized protein (DUF58 family)
MTARLNAALLQRLRTTKLQVRRAEASIGLGERRSRSLGPGIEFAEYREYVPGDDIRHVDRHVLARHQRTMVRRFHTEQQLQATVLVDSSGSMAVGDGSKWDQARVLAAAIAAIGVFGGDRVRLGALRGDGRTEWHPLLRSPRNLQRAFGWLDDLRTGGAVDLARAADAALAHATGGQLLVILSDWMVGGIEEALRRFAAARLEVVGVQVIAPEERSPRGISDGPVRVIDAESGEAMVVALDDDGVQHYHAAFDGWQSELRDLVTQHGGRWLPTASDVGAADVVLRWRQEGFVS